MTGTAVAAMALVSAAPAWAQSAAPADQSTPDAAGAQESGAGEIVVTGSRIRGVEAVGSNVIAIDQSAIADEPVTSTNDLLRRVPQVVSLGANRNGGRAQNGAANATRGAGINLRGIGTNATLLLYDGRRFPPQGTQGQYTDPSVLPSIALGRVEVVADGASAIYGSDAIAGVVNFILRKDVDGAEVRARSGFVDGGYDEQQLSAILGRRWSSGSAMIAGEYTRNSALVGTDLPWYQNDNRDRGGRDLRGTNCTPGTITVGGTTYAIPEGGVTAANVGSLVPGTSNKCFNEALESVIPEQQRYSVVASFSQDLGDRIRLFGDGFYSYRNGVARRAGDDFVATVTDANPFFVSPVPGATSERVTYSLVPELGVYSAPYHSYSWNLMGGVEADLFGDWQGTFYYAHGESEDVADRRKGVNSEALAAALIDPDPATAFNPFGGPNNPETLAAIHDRWFQIIGATRLDVANLQVDGSLFDLPGGAVRVAVGGEYRKEYTFTDLVSGPSASLVHTADGGSRNVKAVFGELYVPIFGAGNARPGLEELSLSIAGRYEHYSDFGDTSNPKIGLTYKPIDGVTIRGSYGTSFRAPTFTEVSTIGGGAGLYYDTLPGPNGNLNGIGIAGGNPDLKPETAETWSAGVEIAPRGLPGLSASATYFHIDYSNQIQALRGTPGILTNPLYSSFVVFNPTAAQIDALINSGLPINDDINPDDVQFIADGRRQNLGTSLVSGVDFSVHYQWEIGAAKIDAGAQGTYFTKYSFESVPGSGFTDVVNTINFPQKFRMRADAGIALGKVRARATFNHLSAYDNTTVTPVERISAYDTIDFLLGADITDRFSLTLDVRNLFDADPPFVDTAGGYDPQSTNPIPRLISVTAGIKL
ncbi:MAG TPA: TonB-dependent receptor [Sphingomonas sp.]|nr:TonB-dependent receptor [Sphingomonas sp.]